MNDLLYILVALSLGINFLCICLNKFEDEKKTFNPIFTYKWANLLYFLSFVAPFKFFIDEKEEAPKTKEIISNLNEAHLTHLLNYRSFTVLKLSLGLIEFVLYFIIMFFVKNIHTIFYFLFKTEISPVTGSNLENMYIIMALVMMFGLLIPNIIIKKRANEYAYSTLRDIPLLQMFILLMLRSNKTTSEIFYGLSKINTCYRNVFHIAYLKYMRNYNDCFDFLNEAFKNTDFQETVKIIKSLPNYSKEETIAILENQMNITISDTNNKKRGKDVSGLVLSQATVMFPFLAFCVLVLVPIATYGIYLLNNSLNGF